MTTTLSALFDLIGIEDLALGEGTFERTSSSGGTQEITKINAESLLLHFLPTVKEYGAVGDGSTDDSQAIQDAFDAGGVVIIPPGTFMSSRGPLYINTDNTHVLCFGTIKLMANATPWPEDGEDQNATAVIHFRDCKNGSWYGGVIDASDIGLCNGIALSGVDSRDPGNAVTSGVSIMNVRVINCAHLEDSDDGTGTPHAGGLGNGGGKGITVQFGSPRAMLCNILAEDCAIGFDFAGRVSEEGASNNVVCTNLVAKSCRVGAFFLGTYGPSAPDNVGDLGANYFSVQINGLELVDCGADEPFFGAICGLQAANVRITGLRITNDDAETIGIRGCFRNSEIQGTIDSKQILHAIDLTRNEDGSHVSITDSPSRHSTFDLTCKMRGTGVAGEQLTGTLIKDSGTGSLSSEHNIFRIKVLVGDGVGGYEGLEGEITQDYMDDTLDETNYWELVDLGEGRFSSGTGRVQGSQTDGQEMFVPATSRGRVCYQNLAIQNDTVAGYVALRSGDGNRNVAIRNNAGQSLLSVDADRVSIRTLPLRLPVMTTAEKNALTNLLDGDCVYDSTLDKPQTYVNSVWTSWF